MRCLTITVCLAVAHNKRRPASGCTMLLVEVLQWCKKNKRHVCCHHRYEYHSTYCPPAFLVLYEIRSIELNFLCESSNLDRPLVCVYTYVSAAVASGFSVYSTLKLCLRWISGAALFTSTTGKHYNIILARMLPIMTAGNVEEASRIRFPSDNICEIRVCRDYTRVLPTGSTQAARMILSP